MLSSVHLPETESPLVLLLLFVTTMVQQRAALIVVVHSSGHQLSTMVAPWW